MFNVIDVNPLRALAKRASGRIADRATAQRFEKIAFDRLLKDPRNFRAAHKRDIDNAPDWAREAHARGEELSVYRSNGALAARLHAVARRIAETHAISQTPPTQRPDDSAAIVEAAEFIAKFSRMNFDVAARKALVFARVYASWKEQDEARSVCDAQSLVLLGGRIWHRITSVAELRRVGADFRNCLARTTRDNAYGSQLARGVAQFWVLRDVNGLGLIVAMAPAPLAMHFLEVKGPNNIPVRADDRDLAQLGILIGVRPRMPEPPPSSGPPQLAEAMLALTQPCRCTLCYPLLVRPFRLRRNGAGP
ncbi:MAG: hypothetical protein R3C27_04995 [Hyphomonadaceae bacterium]